MHNFLLTYYYIALVQFYNAQQHGNFELQINMKIEAPPLITSAQIETIGTEWLNKMKLGYTHCELLTEMSKITDIEEYPLRVLIGMYSLWNKGESITDKQIREIHLGHESTLDYHKMIDYLFTSGFIEIENHRRKKSEELVPSPGFIGYIKTSNPAFLSMCKNNEQDKLLNICLTWHTGDSQSPFGKSDIPILKTLVDYHNDPTVKIISSLSTDIHVQCAILYLFSFDFLYHSPMSLNQLVDDIFNQPLQKIKYLNQWRNPEATIFQNGILIPIIGIENNVTAVTLNPSIQKSLTPMELQNSHFKPQINSKHFQIIHPNNIPKVNLHYPLEFQLEVEVFLTQMQPSKLKPYLHLLRANNMTPNLSVMLYGNPGTGKTELVKQLAKKHKRSLVIVNLSGLRDKWFGESEKNITKLFSDLRRLSNTLTREPIVLFNEADGFFQQRSSTGRSIDQTETGITTIFLNELEKYEGILFATSNHTINMDKAFERRWTIKLEVPSPTAEVRLRVLRDRFKGIIPYKALQMIAEKHPFTPAQADNIFKKFILLNPNCEKVNLLEEIVIHEIGGWVPETTPIGFK